MRTVRTVAAVIIFGLAWPVIPCSADPASLAVVGVRELLEARRNARAELIVELQTGLLVRGPIGRTKRSTFHILDGTPRGGRRIAYEEVRAVIDPATHEQLLRQVPGPTRRMPGNGKALAKTWIVIGAVISVVVVVLIITHLE